MAEKTNLGQLGRKMDDQQQRQHFQSWETYWGRPGDIVKVILFIYVSILGHGAPRDKSHKENLIKMLHFNDVVEKVISSI